MSDLTSGLDYARLLRFRVIDSIGKFAVGGHVKHKLVPLSHSFLFGFVFPRTTGSVTARVAYEASFTPRYLMLPRPCASSLLASVLHPLCVRLENKSAVYRPDPSKYPRIQLVFSLGFFRLRYGTTYAITIPIKVDDITCHILPSPHLIRPIRSPTLHKKNIPNKATLSSSNRAKGKSGITVI